MAFLSKVGNMLKQASNKQINAKFASSRPSIFQVIRCMSPLKLSIGGISYGTDDNSFRDAFSKNGEVIEARVILDCETSRSRRFGFLTYTSCEEASSAIQALDGQDLHGHHIRVNYAIDRPRCNFRGGGYSGGGGYGGGGGGGYGGCVFGNYGGPGGSFGGNNSNVGGGMYGSIGSYDGNTSGDNYKSYENFGSYNSNPGQNVDYSSASSIGAFDNSMGNFKVVGSSGDNSDNYTRGGFRGGFYGTYGLGLGGGESNKIGEATEGFNKDDSLESDIIDEPLEANYIDEDDGRDDFTKRAGEVHQDTAFGG